jgi:DsbC/DsbD-like thiol-disulfide interchange protein
VIARAFAAAVLVVAAGCAGARREAARDPSSTDGRVVHVAAVAVDVAPGGSADLVVVLTIDRGFHIQSDAPSRPNYIPTRVRIDPRAEGDHVVLGDPRYPPAVLFALADEPIRTFEGEVAVRVGVRVEGGASEGERTLRGAVRYQACTATSCLFPREEPFTAKVRVARGPAG